MKREHFHPILLPRRLGTQGRLVLLLNRYPHFLDQSYAPELLWYDSNIEQSFAVCCMFNDFLHPFIYSLLYSRRQPIYKYVVQEKKLENCCAQIN